jgi:lipid-A-disaccharide synthase
VSLPHSTSVAAPSRSSPRALRFALVAGEASGDLLGAGLIEQLRRRHPEAQFAGVGGEGMRAAGLDAWHDCGELAVMGLAEVLRHLPRLLRLRRTLRERLLEWRPDVFIGIDAPDFNLGLERALKRAGISTVHYVSPSVWAWRENRAAKIGRSADRVLCLFPIEPPIYARHGVDARFVGHPLADTLPLHPDRAAARAALGLPDDVPVLAVLPGSRLGEIARLGAIFLEAASRVAAELPALRVVVPAANAACRNALQALLSDSRFPVPESRLLDGGAHEAMIAADVVLLASGTATLEAMLAKRAMVVGYRISALTFAIVKGFGLMKTDTYSLPNALAGERLVPELMQDDCTPSALAREIGAWLRTPDRIAALLPRFDAIHRELRRDASARAADAVDELLADAASRAASR